MCAHVSLLLLAGDWCEKNYRSGTTCEINACGNDDCCVDIDDNDLVGLLIVPVAVVIVLACLIGIFCCYSFKCCCFGHLNAPNPIDDGQRMHPSVPMVVNGPYGDVPGSQIVDSQPPKAPLAPQSGIMDK